MKEDCNALAHRVRLIGLVKRQMGKRLAVEKQLSGSALPPSGTLCDKRP